MALTTNITSADAVFLLSVAEIFNKPVPIQGFSADSAFAEDTMAPSEVVMGIDGHLSAGMLHVPIKQKITIMPDSESVLLFDTWYMAQKTDRSIYYASGTIILNSVKKVYTLTRGVLTGIKLIPDVKKVLQAHEYEITWESVTTSII